MNDSASVDQADSVRKAILAAHAARHTPGPKMALPNSTIISTAPYVGFRHPQEMVGKMLGAPETIMLAECVKPGYKYVWYSRRDVRTTAKLRSNTARAVTMDEIDKSNPDAEVIEIVTPNGSGVVWENMLLCELAPKWASRLYTDYERWAIAQLAQHEQEFAAEVSDTTQGAYKGEFSVKDPLVGR